MGLSGLSVREDAVGNIFGRWWVILSTINFVFYIHFSHTIFKDISSFHLCKLDNNSYLLLNKAGCLCFKVIINLIFLFVIFGLKCSILSTYLYTSLYFFGFHFSVILLVLCLLQGWLWARSCSSCDWFSYRCYSIFWEIWWSCWCFRCNRSHKCAKKVSTFWLMWIRVFAIKTERLYCFSLDIFVGGSRTSVAPNALLQM